MQGSAIISGHPDSSTEMLQALPGIRVTVVPIKGDVEEIERLPGRTEVIVDEGMNTVSYELNEALISFGSAVDGGDLQQASKMVSSAVYPEDAAPSASLDRLKAPASPTHPRAQPEHP